MRAVFFAERVGHVFLGVAGGVAGQEAAQGVGRSLFEVGRVERGRAATPTAAAAPSSGEALLVAPPPAPAVAPVPVSYPSAVVERTPVRGWSPWRPERHLVIVRVESSHAVVSEPPPELPWPLSSPPSPRLRRLHGLDVCVSLEVVDDDLVRLARLRVDGHLGDILVLVWRPAVRLHYSERYFRSSSLILFRYRCCLYSFPKEEGAGNPASVATSSASHFLNVRPGHGKVRGRSSAANVLFLVVAGQDEGLGEGKVILVEEDRLGVERILRSSRPGLLR